MGSICPHSTAFLIDRPNLNDLPETKQKENEPKLVLIWFRLIDNMIHFANVLPNWHQSTNKMKWNEIRAWTATRRVRVHLIYRTNGFADDESSLIHYLICLIKSSRLSIRFYLILLHRLRAEPDWPTDRETDSPVHNAPNIAFQWTRRLGPNNNARDSLYWFICIFALD